MEKVKVVIEVRGGLVQSVYAGDFVEAVVIDHDTPSVYQTAVEPLRFIDPKDTAAYDGGFPDGWEM